jgi:hypothetical protein
MIFSVTDNTCADKTTVDLGAAAGTIPFGFTPKTVVKDCKWWYTFSNEKEGLVTGDATN